MPENKFKIGITQGDTNGIGWEIILKALADPRMTELFTPVVYGSPKAAAYYRNTVAEIEAFSFNPVASAAEARRGKANLVACGETADIAPGKPTPEAGRAAVEALCAAMRDLKAGHLDALVTAPFDKETVQADDFRYTGQTEYLAAELEGEAMMILCSDVLRVGLVTKHIPVSTRCAVRSSRTSASSSRASPSWRSTPTPATADCWDARSRRSSARPLSRRFRKACWPSGLLPPTGFSPGADTPSTTVSWPCTTTRGWRRSRACRPTG